MVSELGSSSEDGERTPPAPRTLVLSFQPPLRLFQIRHTGYQRQRAALKEKVTRIDDLTAALSELRARVNQHSRNSSKPLSSAPPHQPPRPPPNAPRGRTQGAQPGQHGAGRSLKPAEAVAAVVELRPVSGRTCGHTLVGDDPHPSRHQVTEVPRARAEVTEYRRHPLRCPACGTTTRAARPADNLLPGSFGAPTPALIG